MQIGWTEENQAKPTYEGSHKSIDGVSRMRTLSQVERFIEASTVTCLLSISDFCIEQRSLYPESLILEKVSR
jgi:hypothetical protein